MQIRCGKINFDAVKNMCGFNMSNLFYAASCLFILFGLAKVIGPILGESMNIAETLPCLGAINIYEIMLIGLAVFLVVKKNITDDAVTLLSISAVFFVANAVTLSTIANDSPKLSIAIGLSLCGLFIYKVTLISKTLLKADWWQSLRYPFAIAIIGLYTIPEITAYLTYKEYDSEEFLRSMWLFGWFFSLIPCVWILYLVSIKNKTEKMEISNSEEAIDNKESAINDNEEATINNDKPESVEENDSVTPENRKPFLFTNTMAWLFCLITIALTALGHYSTGFIYSVKQSAGDYIPFVLLFVLILEELLFDKKSSSTCWAKISLNAVLVFIITAVIKKGTFIQPIKMSVFTPIWYLPLFFVLYGVLRIAINILERDKSYTFVSGLIWIAFGLSTMGAEPFHRLRPDPAYIFSVLCALMYYAAYRHKAFEFATIGTIIFTILVCSSRTFDSFAYLHRIEDFSFLIMFYGMGQLAVYAVFGRAVPRWINFAASLLVYLGFSAMVKDGMPHTTVAIMAALITVLAIWLIIRFKSFWAVAPLFFVLIHGGWIFFDDILPEILSFIKEKLTVVWNHITSLGGWVYIIASFILLIAGAFIRIRKNRINEILSEEYSE